MEEVWLGLGAKSVCSSCPLCSLGRGLGLSVLSWCPAVDSASAGLVEPQLGGPLWSEPDHKPGCPDAHAAQMRKLRPGWGPGSPCHPIWVCGKEEAESKDVRRGLAVSSEVGAGAEAQRAGSGQAGRGLLWAHRPGCQHCPAHCGLRGGCFAHSVLGFLTKAQLNKRLSGSVRLWSPVSTVLALVAFTVAHVSGTAFDANPGGGGISQLRTLRPRKIEEPA